MCRREEVKWACIEVVQVFKFTGRWFILRLQVNVSEIDCMRSASRSDGSEDFSRITEWKGVMCGRWGFLMT
jgi:hypothetical protein